jgi:hypothetical protein
MSVVAQQELISREGHTLVADVTVVSRDKVPAAVALAVIGKWAIIDNEALATLSLPLEASVNTSDSAVPYIVRDSYGWCALPDLTLIATTRVDSDLGRLASEYGLTLMSEFGDTNVGQFSAPNAPDDIFMFLKIMRTDASIFSVKLCDIFISLFRIDATSRIGQL